MNHQNIMYSMENLFSKESELKSIVVADKASTMLEFYLKSSIYQDFDHFMSVIKRMDTGLYNCVRTGMFSPADPELASQYMACLLCLIAPVQFPVENYDFFTEETVRKDDEVLKMLKDKTLELINESKLLSESMIHAVYETPDGPTALHEAFKQIDSKVRRVLSVSGYVMNLIRFKALIKDGIFFPVINN